METKDANPAFLKEVDLTRKEKRNFIEIMPEQTPKPICSGIDVHKDILVVTVGITDPDSGKSKFFQRTWKTAFYRDLIEIEQWLQSYGCCHVCMESTGKYWRPIFDVLSNTCEVVLVNAAHVKALYGKKTDKIDSLRLCFLHKHDLIPASFIQNKELTDIRETQRRRRKLVENRNSEVQRLNDCLVTSNVRLSSVFSQITGVSSMNIINYMIEHPGDTEFDIEPLIHYACKTAIDEIKAAIQGGFSEGEVIRIKSILKHIEFLDNEIEEMERVVDEMLAKIDKVNEVIELLKTLPVKNPDIFIKTFITEVGLDVDAWETPSKFISWLGLSPGKHESAGKNKGTRVSRAQKYLKPVIIQLVLSIVRSNTNSYYKERYWQLVARIGKNKARIAVARMIMRSIYTMIKYNEPYNSELYDYYMKQDNVSRKQVKSVNKEELKRLAKELGFDLVAIKNDSLTESPTIGIIQ